LPTAFSGESGRPGAPLAFSSGKVFPPGIRPVAGDVEEYSQGSHVDEQGRSAVADQGKGNARHGKDRRHHGQIEQGLDGDGADQADAEQGSERIRGDQGGANAPQNHSHKEEDQEEASKKAQFLGNDGKDEVGVRLVQIGQFLDPVSQSPAGQTSGTDGIKGLDDLVSRVVGILPGVVGRFQALDPVIRQIEDHDQHGHRYQPQQQQVADPRAGAENHHYARGQDDDRGAVMGFDHDQEADQSDHNQRGKQPPREVVQMGLLFGIV